MKLAFGILLVVFAIGLAVGAVPLGMLFAAFASDDGKASPAFLWGVFGGFCLMGLVPAALLGWFGWTLVR